MSSEKSIQKLARTGENIKVECPISGYPAPIIEWWKGNEIIDYSWLKIRTKNKIMKIRNAKVKDTGVYSCKGVNGFGNIEVKVNIIVFGEIG